MKFTKTPIALAAITLLCCADRRARGHRQLQGAVRRHRAQQHHLERLERLRSRRHRHPPRGLHLRQLQHRPGHHAEHRHGFAVALQPGVQQLRRTASTPLRAVAYDSAGRTASTSRTITINNTTTDAKPTISFTAPGNNATIGAVDHLPRHRQRRPRRQAGRSSSWTARCSAPIPARRIRAPSTTSSTRTARTPCAHASPIRRTRPPKTQITVNITGGIAHADDAGHHPADGADRLAGFRREGRRRHAVRHDGQGQRQVAKVDVYLQSGTTQKLVDSKTTAPYTGTLDTAGLPNGTATLMAIATDTAGLTSSTQRSVTIDNGTSHPRRRRIRSRRSGGGTPTTLPSTNAQAVPTFESLGMYWKPGSNPGAAGCSVRYRKTTESTWKRGLPDVVRQPQRRMPRQHRAPRAGHRLHGRDGRRRRVQGRRQHQDLVGQLPDRARPSRSQSGSQTLAITEGGTKDGYVLYTGPATIDVANAQDYNVAISAPYVIVRGLTLKGAKIARRQPAARRAGRGDRGQRHQRLGRDSGTGCCGGVQVGTDQRLGDPRRLPRPRRSLERAVIQRNKLHDPRYGANSWDYGAPARAAGDHLRASAAATT